MNNTLYTICELKASIDDIDSQYESSKLSYIEAIQLIKNCCNQFIVDNKGWGEAFGDNYPSSNECPDDVIAHHAQMNDLTVSDDLAMFAKSMWTEGNLYSHTTTKNKG